VNGGKGADRNKREEGGQTIERDNIRKGIKEKIIHTRGQVARKRRRVGIQGRRREWD